MRYLVVGALTITGIVLASIAAMRWALHGAEDLAWAAFAFGVVGVLVLIACLCLYLLSDRVDIHEEQPGWDFGPVGTPRDRAHERAWLREPPGYGGARSAARGASAPRAGRGDAYASKRTVSL